MSEDKSNNVVTDINVLPTIKYLKFGSEKNLIKCLGFSWFVFNLNFYW